MEAVNHGFGLRFSSAKFSPLWLIKFVSDGRNAASPKKLSRSVCLFIMWWLRSCWCFQWWWKSLYVCVMFFFLINVSVSSPTAQRERFCAANYSKTPCPHWLCGLSSARPYLLWSSTCGSLTWKHQSSAPPPPRPSRAESLRFSASNTERNAILGWARLQNKTIYNASI